MTIYYVDSTATGGTNAGTSWVNAYLAFGSAVTAATASGDFIYVSHAHSESLSADTTYTFANNVQVLCVNSSTGALATTALIGAQATNYYISLAGAYRVYWNGVSLKAGTNTNSAKQIILNATDGGHYEFENINVTFNQTSATACYVQIGTSSATLNSYTKISNCTIKFSNASGKIVPYGLINLIGVSIDQSGSAPSNLFQPAAILSSVTSNGCDYSKVTGNLVGNVAGAGTAVFLFINSKLGSGVVPLAAATTVTNKGQTTVEIYNCASGDTHYNFGHYDAFGQTIATTAVYANSGAKYDGTNGVSWAITTTANCSYWTPYVSPWIQKYHSGTSAITPRLEVLRDGSSTAYKDDEVWGEWSYQGTSGYPLGTLVNDRMTPLGSSANQGSSSLGASDWTGESGTNWYGKLEPAASITPAEIGHLMARVYVGVASSTVYVDPTIRT